MPRLIENQHNQAIGMLQSMLQSFMLLQDSLCIQPQLTNWETGTSRLDLFRTIPDLVNPGKPAIRMITPYASGFCINAWSVQDSCNINCKETEMSGCQYKPSAAGITLQLMGWSPIDHTNVSSWHLLTAQHVYGGPGLCRTLRHKV